MNAQSKSVVRGATWRPAYLIAQGQVAVALVRSDTPVAMSAGQELLAKVDREVQKLKDLHASWKEARYEAKKRTHEEQAAKRDGVLWLRKFAHAHRSSLLQGNDLPPLVARVKSATANSGKVALAIEEMVRVATIHMDALRPCGITPEFVKQGVALGKALGPRDEKQELARTAELVEKHDALAKQKRIVHALIRQLYSHAYIVYAHDRAMRSRYSMKILYRGAAAGTSDPPPAKEAG